MINISPPHAERAAIRSRRERRRVLSNTALKRRRQANYVDDAFNVADVYGKVATRRLLLYITESPGRLRLGSCVSVRRHI